MLAGMRRSFPYIYRYTPKGAIEQTCCNWGMSIVITARYGYATVHEHQDLLCMYLAAV